MAKKKTIKPPPDELYYIKCDLEQVNSSTSELFTKVGDLTRYTEYLARNVDLIICYSEYLAEDYSSIREQNFGNGRFAPQRRAPTFDEYKEIKGTS